MTELYAELFAGGGLTGIKLGGLAESSPVGVKLRERSGGIVHAPSCTGNIAFDTFACIRTMRRCLQVVPCRDGSRQT